jgi:hypothetical protein
VVDVASQIVARSKVRNSSLDVAVITGSHGVVLEVEESLSPAVGTLLQAALTEVHQRQVLAQADVSWSTPVAATATTAPSG